MPFNILYEPKFSTIREMFEKMALADRRELDALKAKAQRIQEEEKQRKQRRARRAAARKSWARKSTPSAPSRRRTARRK